jgi:CheY-like chemotaxis protein
MQVNCEQCQSKFNLPDEKVPEGKVTTLRCPKCKSPITIDTTPAVPPSSPFQASEDDYDAGDKPFDFIEEEEKTALVCEPDAIIREQITTTLDMLEYHITVCDSARDALKKMRYHIYDLVVLNENFDTPDPDSNGILIYLERLQMAVRRGIYVLFISTRFRTMDHMMSFNKSVDLIMNPQNIADFEKVLKRGLAEHQMNYRVYRETLKKLGRV